MSDIKIYQMTPTRPPKGWKKKMGLIAWRGDVLYVPACTTGMSDHEAFMCCAYDGESVCRAEGTVLVLETWARRERPDRSEMFDLIRKRALEMRDGPMGAPSIEEALDRLPGEQVKIKCGSCKKSTRIPKAEFWGKIFRCVHCCEVIADERNLRIDQ